MKKIILHFEYGMFPTWVEKIDENWNIDPSEIFKGEIVDLIEKWYMLNKSEYDLFLETREESGESDEILFLTGKILRKVKKDYPDIEIYYVP